MPTSLKLHCLNVICRHTQFVSVSCTTRFLSYQQSSSYVWPEVSPYISRVDSPSFLMTLHLFLYPSWTLWLLAIIVQMQGLHLVSGSSSFVWPVTNCLWCLSCLWCDVLHCWKEMLGFFPNSECPVVFQFICFKTAKQSFSKDLASIFCADIAASLTCENWHSTHGFWFSTNSLLACSTLQIPHTSFSPFPFPLCGSQCHGYYPLCGHEALFYC
jgi:hypothetical protein